MEILHEGKYSASSTLIESGELIMVSRIEGNRIELMLFECRQSKKSSKTFLREQIKSVQSLAALDARAVRKNVSSLWGSYMTKHIMQVQNEISRDDSDIVAFTAWKYATLTSWGEASAAREISLELETSINTIYYRLKLARDRKILNSPGPGSRLGE